MARYMGGSPALGVYAPRNLSLYGYAGNNPTGYKDSTGKWIESAWDAFSLATGVASLVENVREGNWGSAALDAGGVVVDAAALILPAVPAGAGVLLKSGRAADKLNDARKAANIGTDTAKTVAKVEKVADKAVDAEKAIAKVENAAEGVSDAAKGAGRAGKQERLKQIAADPNTSRADRGWIKQEQNAIERGNRTSIRNPPGKDLAHTRGREAAKGYSHTKSPSNLQDRGLHKTQHKFDDFGRKNRERP